tara:strand:+ start:547 stop:2175 length:1629 start_codon:yes stop_codon:yes gene_type:complete
MILIYLYLISFSLIGYGMIVSKVLSINLSCFGIYGILGITFLGIISYVSSIFISHNIIFNSVILLIGLLLFLYNIILINNFKREFFILCVTCFFAIIFILIAKNHDDFPYYHFPYISLLTEYSHPIGIGVLNNGFRSPSSIFFISSMFYLPKSEIFLFHLTPAFIQIFANIVFLKMIFDKKIFSQNKFYNFYSLFAFCFINIFFYRLAEHGTDRSGMILLLIAFVYLIHICTLEKKLVKNSSDLFKIFVILIFFVVSIKPFYLINLLLFIIIFYYGHTRKIFSKLLFTPVFFYSLSFLFFTIFFTFLNSGCLIFPINQTCFYNLEWSLNKEIIQDVKVWFELWSKSGARPNFVVENRIEYISDFNWLNSWFQNYFFNKVSDFLLGIFFTILIFYLIFYRPNIKKKTKISNYHLFYVFLIFCLVEWFLKHPSLRYGGYHILALIFFIPASLHLSKLKLNFDDYYKKTLILVLVVVTIFISRNTQRLINENKLYDYNILKNPNYKFIGGDKNFYFRYNNSIKENIDKINQKNYFGKKILILGNK